MEERQEANLNREESIQQPWVNRRPLRSRLQELVEDLGVAYRWERRLPEQWKQARLRAPLQGFHFLQANPFHSDKIKVEVELARNRPISLDNVWG